MSMTLERASQGVVCGHDDPAAKAARAVAMWRSRGWRGGFVGVARELGMTAAAVYEAVQADLAARVAVHRARRSPQLRPSNLPGPSGRTRAPRVTPIFPPGAFVPTSVCRCSIRPIKPGERLYCAVCHKSGFDGRPWLRIGPGDEPAPTPRQRSQRPDADRESRRVRRMARRLGF